MLEKLRNRKSSRLPPHLLPLLLRRVSFTATTPPDPAAPHRAPAPLVASSLVIKTLTYNRHHHSRDPKPESAARHRRRHHGAAVSPSPSRTGLVLDLARVTGEEGQEALLPA